MSGRQIFSISEKLCLQELIIKYKLNLASTKDPAIKKIAWARLVEEYNSIETNCKRTETQLKKCWDNLKTRKKALLAQEKKECMKTGEGCYYLKPGTSREDPLLVDEAFTEPISLHKIENFIASDNDPYEDTLHTPASPIMVQASESGSQEIHKEDINIRARIINEELLLRKNNYYARLKEREEEVHNLVLEEKRWLVKAAEEKYIKALIERKNAENVLHFNQLKRELELYLK